MHVRDVAYWFDYSTPIYVECVVEDLAVGLPTGTLAAVEVPSAFT